MSKLTISHYNLGSGLSASLAKLLFSNAQVVRLDAGEALCVAGDSGNGCYLVEHGLLKASVISQSGDERILAIMGVGSVVGELAMIDGRPRSANVTALTKTELRFLNAARFRALADRHPEAYGHVLELLAGRMRGANNTIAASSFLSSKGRLAWTFLILADALGETIAGSQRTMIRQRITQQDIAEMAGVARETVTRLLSEWKRLGLISKLGRHYSIERKAVLEQLARI